MPTEPPAGSSGEARPDLLLAVLALAAAALLFYAAAFHLGAPLLPLLSLALGCATYLWDGRRALQLFLFLLPLVNATPDLVLKGVPFNYLGVSLFQLAGMLLAALGRREPLAAGFPGRGPYRLFLGLLWISAAFVFLRWSNLGLPALALLRDTPVAPSMDRVSFAVVFPAITLALFSLAPWAAVLLRRWRLGGADAFVPLKAGFVLSFLLALAQKWIDPDFLAQSWWGIRMKQLNGGFSDFNAFGFFAGAMFLWQALDLMGRADGSGPTGTRAGGRPRFTRLLSGRGAGFAFLAVALAAVSVSGCRTAFLFVLAALLRFFAWRRPGLRAKAVVALLLAAALLVGGGTLGRRLWDSLVQAARLPSAGDRFQAIDRISNGRLAMLRDGAGMVLRFPASGVGAGNFYFHLKHLRHGEDHWLDLPLNQYLLFFTETGLAGGLVFLLFLAALLRGLGAGTPRALLAAMAVALLFNNFFWFPEALLLFWIVTASAAWPPAPKPPGGRAWAAAVLFLFSAMNAVHVRDLHPRTLARQAGTAYDYGFSYREANAGRSFRWTGGKAGLYVYTDEGDGVYRLFCGAPLPRLPGQRQVVDVYWRGKLLSTFVFRSNRSFRLRLAGAGEGFLEFRVRPTFNLERMGLGAESRDLGVQVSGPGI